MKKILLILIACQMSLLSLTAKEFYGYTKDRPLVIVCDWDFRPFEFLDNEGKPAGYNVDVLNLILDRLDIPHKFVMQEWHLGTEMFERRDADLIHALTYAYKGHPYVQTKKYVNYYAVKAVHRNDVPPLQSLSNLTSEDTLLLKDHDYAALRIKDMHDKPFATEYCSPKVALTAIHAGRVKYYIWGEKPLELKIKELGLDSLLIDDVDIPPAELRIIGYDKDLVDIIDDEYTRLEQNGELDKILNKWFHPERVEESASPLALIILIALAIIGVIAFLLSRLITLRVKAAVRKSADLNNMMTTALSMGEYYVTEYDLKNDTVRNIYGDLLSLERMTSEEVLNHIDPRQRDEFRKNIAKLINGSLSQVSLRKRWNIGTPENPQWRELEGVITAEKVDGKPRYLINTIKDITREVMEEQDNRALFSKYMKVFDINIVAMSFYGSNGKLVDLNQKMRELSGLTPEQEEYFRQGVLFDNPLLKGAFDPKSHDVFHVCQRMHYPEIGIDKYIEMRIRPTFNDAGQLVYYVIMARDVTDERTMYMEQHKHEVEINKTHESINEYEQQLRYLLEQNDMFIWYYNDKTDLINFTRTPREREYSETVEEFFAGVPEEERIGSLAKLKEAIAKREPFNAIHHYNYTPLEKNPVWYSISGIPTFDKDGELIEYFGVARNVTNLMLAQQKLKEETARAEDSGRLKAAFLANMTHEIRTPLNAIVGFSDILQMVDTPEERMEFIRIIRNNCDMLLRLINDILEASSMGQALAIEPANCDFSQVFNDICQTLEQRVAEAGVPFVKDNPYDTFPATLDKGRIQQVLTNFTTNAVKYTKTGHIKVGYRAEDNGIYFYCEDTGAGIPKEKQAAVFERFVKLNDFVQGTGLGLSICKAIVERCNGKIGVTSEGEGHGSTFWFWIPQ